MCVCVFCVCVCEHCCMRIYMHFKSMRCFLLFSICLCQDVGPVQMARCVTSVRLFVESGGPSIDWLTEKANNDIDSVLLYLLRLCYYHSTPSDELQTVFDSIKTSVASFSPYELTLLQNVLADEASAQAHRISPIQAEVSHWSTTSVTVAIGAIISMLAIKRRIK